MTDVQTKKPADYTEGPILRSILKMGVPSMFGFLAHHIYAMADTYWVSRLPEGESAVAAITFFNSMMWLLFSFNSLVGPGSVAIISRRYGEKEFDQTERAIKETFLLKLVFGAIFGWSAFVFVKYILLFLGAEGDALRMGIGYGRIMLIGLPVLYATFSVFTAMRGIANPKMAMVMMLASSVLNIVIDPIFIFGWFGMPALGIEGAAYASVGSYTLTFIVGLALLYGGRTNVRLHLRGKVAVGLNGMWQILKLGIPAWVGEASFSSARLVIVPLVATFGTTVVAAYGVSTQLFAFGIMVLVGMGLGLSSLIGHNLGSGKVERAKKTGDTAIWLGVGIMAVMSLLILGLAQYYMRFFFDNAETISTGVTILRIWAIAMPFYGAFIMAEMIHSGVGLNTPLMIISIIHSWLFQAIPILFLVQFMGLGQNAIWWTLSISGIISTLIFVTYYRRGRWLTVKV